MEQPDSVKSIRLATSIAVVSLLVALGCVATLVWMDADPQWWFPGAFAEEGPRGDQGPIGEQGPRGEPGPVGPDAANAVGAIQSQLDDLAGRVDDLELSVDPTVLEDDIDELRSDLKDLCNSIEGEFRGLYLSCYY